QSRILRPQLHQPGKTATAWHAQVEQDEIDVAAALGKVGDLLEGAGFRDIDLAEQAGDGFTQGAAEQRMIVRDQEAVGLSLAQGITPSIEGAGRAPVNSSSA